MSFDSRLPTVKMAESDTFACGHCGQDQHRKPRWTHQAQMTCGVCIAKFNMKEGERVSDESTTEEVDMVLRPAHYNKQGIEALDVIAVALGDEGFRDYCHGNAMKYIYRAKFKHDDGGDEDVRKAIFYLRAMIGDDPRKDR